MTVAAEALRLAIRAHDRDQIATLLSADAMLYDSTGPSSESLVLHACYVGASDVVDLLTNGRALDVAECAAVGDVPALKRALSGDPDAIRRHTADGWTPLHLAGFFGRDDVAAALIDAGAPLELLSTNATHNMPLHAALAGACNAGLVKRLVMAGADVRARGETGITPLHIAASRGNADLCELLVARGALPHATMDDGTTPAMLATARGFGELSDKLAAMA